MRCYKILREETRRGTLAAAGPRLLIPVDVRDDEFNGTPATVELSSASRASKSEVYDDDNEGSNVVAELQDPRRELRIWPTQIPSEAHSTVGLGSALVSERS